MINRLHNQASTSINRLSLLHIIVSIIFAALSFFPCIKELVYGPPHNDLALIPGPYASYFPYFPGLVCALTTIEILLLLFFRRYDIKVAGLVLNIIKTAAPIPLQYLLEYYPMLFGIPSLSLTLSGYIVISLGCMSAILYLISFFWNPKPTARTNQPDSVA